MKSEQSLLRVSGISKVFVTARVLTSVDLEINKDEIRGLIGENGSGKSTLSSIIAGSLEPNEGTMLKDGKPYKPSSMLDGRGNGISIMVQEAGTINGLKVYENIFLGRESIFKKSGMINRKSMILEAKKVLAGAGAEYINPAVSIDTLSFEDRKLVEVATVLYYNPDLLILDETTTALSQKGREKIYAIMHELKKQNKSVLFISHDLSELEEVCDSITVLRDGNIIKTLQKEEITTDNMRQLMIGRDLTGHYYRNDSVCDYEDEVVLRAEGICLDKILKNISLDLHKGEILGIGGLTECGMHELCKILFGIIKADSGRVVLPAWNVEIKKAAQAVKYKMAFLPKDREKEALFSDASILDNVVLMSCDKLKTGVLISPNKEQKLACEQADLLKVKMTSIKQWVRFLSGGNKQKVVIAKWLANDSQILIMDCPTRGIDIGVKAAIYRLMEELKKKGCSIIMISEELPELIGMSDRILILKDGEMSGEFNRNEQVSEAQIIQKMI